MTLSFMDDSNSKKSYTKVDPLRLEGWLLRNGFQPHRSREDEFIRQWCPDCGEGKDWRLMVNAQSGYVNCWGCGSGRKNVFRWVAEADGITIQQAIEAIGKLNDLPDFDEVWAEVSGELEFVRAKHTYEAPDTSGTVWGEPTRPWHEEALAALAARGFDREWCMSRGIGFGHAGRWTNRVVIPCFLHGHFVWAQAWDWTKTSDIKYQSPPTTPGVIGRRQIIFGYDMYRATQLPIVVGEGVYNAWSAEQVGYPAVATFGKSVTMEQTELLLSMDQGPGYIICLDADAASQARTLAEQLIELGRAAWVVQWPDSRDLNDHTPTDRLALLQSAIQPSMIPEPSTPFRSARGPVSN